MLKKVTPFERDLLEERIRSAGPLDESEITSIAKKHGRILPKDKTYNFLELFGEHSAARLLFISRGPSIPGIFLTALRKHVQPHEEKYLPVETFSQEEGIIGEIVLREGFKDDIVRLIRLVNTTKLTTTKESIYPTKAAAVKINGALGNKEIVVEVS